MKEKKKANELLGGQLGKVERVDGIRYVFSPKLSSSKRLADNEALEKLKDAEAGQTFTSEDGITFIITRYSDIVDKKIYDILVEHLGEMNHIY